MTLVQVFDESRKTSEQAGAWTVEEMKQSSDGVQCSASHKENVSELRLQRIDLVHDSEGGLRSSEHGVTYLVIISLNPTLELVNSAEPKLQRIAFIGHRAANEIVIVGCRYEPLNPPVFAFDVIVNV